MNFSVKKIILILALLAITAVGSVALYAQHIKSKDIVKTEQYPIEQEFLINVKSKEGTKKILKTSVTLEIKGKKSSEILDANGSVVSDTIINTISSKNDSQLSVEKRDVLKKNLAKNINKALKEDIVVNIFFRDFLVD